MRWRVGTGIQWGSRQVSCITLALVFPPSQILVLVDGSSEDQSVAEAFLQDLAPRPDPPVGQAPGRSRAIVLCDNVYPIRNWNSD